MNQWILFMLGTVINHHRGFVHIPCTLAFCQNRILMHILSYLLCIFVISHMNSWMLYIFSIVTIYHKCLMHVRFKFTPCQNRVHQAISAIFNSPLLELTSILRYKIYFCYHWPPAMWGICVCQNLFSVKAKIYSC